MLVDAHHHLIDYARWRYPWMTPEYAPLRGGFDANDLHAAVDATPVAATVAVQAIAEPEETQWLLQIAQRDELVAAVVGWVDLTAPDVTERIAKLQDGDSLLRGIRHQAQDENNPDWLARPDVMRGLRAVANADLTFDLLLQRRNVASAVLVARSMPELRLVVDHGANPHIADGEWDSWTASLRRLAAFPQVLCKISGLVTNAPWDAWRTADIQRYMEEIVATFGSQRVMFGSDWPVCTVAASYRETYAIANEGLGALSTAERNEVFGETARRAYRIEGRVSPA